MRSTGSMRRIGVIGVSVAALALPAPGAGAKTPAGLAAAARILLSDAPSFLVPGAERLPPFVVSTLSAEVLKSGYRLGFVPIVDSPGDRPYTTRIAFFPRNGTAWGLQWGLGDDMAAVLMQTREGTTGTDLDSLPEYELTDEELDLETHDREIDVETITSRFLKRNGLKLGADTAVQVVHEFELGGATGWQGSPIVSLGTLTGSGPSLAFPPFGITYQPNGSSQPWAVVPSRYRFSAGDFKLKDFGLSLTYPTPDAAEKALQLIDEIRLFHTDATFTPTRLTAPSSRSTATTVLSAGEPSQEFPSLAISRATSSMATRTRSRSWDR